MEKRLAKISIAIAALACNFTLIVSKPSQASTLIFSDNFDAENNGIEATNYTSLTNWRVSEGAIDIIGNGGRFDFLPGNGLYIDLDGTNFAAGAGRIESSILSFGPAGKVILNFDLAGNQRFPAPQDSVTVSLSNLFSETFSLPSSAPFQTFTRTVQVPSLFNARLIFEHSGADQIGMLLDNVSVSVNSPPDTPTISPTSVTINEGQSVNITISGTDVNPEPLSFYLNNELFGIDSSTSGIRSVSRTNTFQDDGVFTNTVYAQDSIGQISNTVTQKVTVLNANPEIKQLSVPATVDEGSVFSFSASVTDPGTNDVISYSWDLDGDGGFGDYNLSEGDFSYPDEGIYRFGLNVSDGDGGSAAETLDIEVKNVDPNITKLTGDLNVKANETFSFLAEAFDPGVNDTLTFDWDLDGDGEFDDFTGSEGQVILEDIFEKVFEEPEQIKIALRVSDGDGGVTEQSFSVTVTPNNSQPDPPVFSSSNITIDEGQNVDITISATDADPEPLSFFLNDELIGTVPSTSGTRSISTNLGPFIDEGMFNNIAYVKDASDQRSETTVQTINVLNVAPTITQLTENLVVKPNELFDFFADASDPGLLDELTFDWELSGNSLFDDFTGKRGQWLFSEPGLFDIALRVSDGDGGEAFQSFSVEAVTTLPETVPEAGSMFGILSFSMLGLSIRLKRRFVVCRIDSDCAIPSTEL
ncbi:hypothetical protein IQ260_13580 [Leptolyngbya cf. ectocarpi LEGE 11479]|uniref:PKD domain-containing protein n=1 Tax=Leptolyngbya cf. ectocarpi LEGE 11479 TaxID=1828722 RepID=A0A929F6J1_LEPEC|nr:PKD domain-containing protein [Leptolyngbya ectocarpi]MBE9067686.1 hypothetical protein [Leptolyngbya cf. ectocarpi LEGE 11479]